MKTSRVISKTPGEAVGFFPQKLRSIGFRCCRSESVDTQHKKMTLSINFFTIGNVGTVTVTLSSVLTQTTIETTLLSGSNLITLRRMQKMTISKISKILASTTLLAGISFGAFAAENASGVAEHLSMLVETTKAAQTAATGGDKDGCVSNIKQAIQHYKELTGAPNGKPMQDAMKLMKEAKEDCSNGNTAEAASKLTGVIQVEQKIQAENSR
jgi:hypothetical protein